MGRPNHKTRLQVEQLEPRVVLSAFVIASEEHGFEKSPPPAPNVPVVVSDTAHSAHWLRKAPGRWALFQDGERVAVVRRQKVFAKTFPPRKIVRFRWVVFQEDGSRDRGVAPTRAKAFKLVLHHLPRKLPSDF